MPIEDISRRAVLGAAAATAVGALSTQAVAQGRRPPRRGASQQKCFCSLVFPEFNTDEFLDLYDEYTNGTGDYEEEEVAPRSRGQRSRRPSARDGERFFEFIAPFIPTLVDVIADAVTRGQRGRGDDLVSASAEYTPRSGEEGPLSRAAISVTLSL